LSYKGPEVLTQFKIANYSMVTLKEGSEIQVISSDYVVVVLVVVPAVAVVATGTVFVVIAYAVVVVVMAANNFRFEIWIFHLLLKI